MTEEQAFLASILELPADDLRRLAYCDWLEENAGPVPCPHPHCRSGWIHDADRYLERLPPAMLAAAEKRYDPETRRIKCGVCSGAGCVDSHRAERAEFIRLQVELAKEPDCPFPRPKPRHGPPRNPHIRHVIEMGPETGPCGFCPVCVMRRRERDLWPVVYPVFRQAVPDSLTPTISSEGPFRVPAAVVARGLVAEVRCRLADWVGGRCRSCFGPSGEFRANDLRPFQSCPICHGNHGYTTPGVGPAVVAAHPVERVEVIDREPREVIGGAAWDDAASVSLVSRRESELPSDVFATLDGGECGYIYAKVYRDRAAAIDALSVGLLSVGLLAAARKPPQSTTEGET